MYDSRAGAMEHVRLISGRLFPDARGRRLGLRALPTQRFGVEFFIFHHQAA
jgi:hypothetical protein